MPVCYADPDFSRVFRKVRDRYCPGEPYHPVVHVKWDADGYRLPTLAEWCVAYGPSPRADGELGWIGENSGGKTHPVGTKAPNAYGLHDMLGNV